MELHVFISTNSRVVLIIVCFLMLNQPRVISAKLTVTLEMLAPDGLPLNYQNHSVVGVDADLRCLWSGFPPTSRLRIVVFFHHIDYADDDHLDHVHAKHKHEKHKEDANSWKNLASVFEVQARSGRLWTRLLNLGGEYEGLYKCTVSWMDLKSMKLFMKQSDMMNVTIRGRDRKESEPDTIDHHRHYHARPGSIWRPIHVVITPLIFICVALVGSAYYTCHLQRLESSSVPSPEMSNESTPTKDERKSKKSSSNPRPSGPVLVWTQPEDSVAV